MSTPSAALPGHRPPPPLSDAQIFWFWSPLALMWLIMAVEQPLIAAVIARLPDPEPNLAAFGITFSLALLVEGPVIMLLTAGTALPRDGQSYRRLLHFTHLLAGGLTGLHLLLGLTPLYSLLVGRLIGAPAELLEPSRTAFLLMAPWTAAIAYRRLWQGVLIRFNRTHIVPVTISARLVTTGTVLLLGLAWGRAPGVTVGATALSLGVIMAAIVSYLFARPTIRRRLNALPPQEPPLTWRALLDFYLPLALTSLIVLTAQPVLAVGLARAPDPLASLAVWPVIMGFLFLGRALALSFQEAAVALLERPGAYDRLSRFSWRLAGTLTMLVLLVAATPLARIWYTRVAGLDPGLLPLAVAPTLILALVPGMNALISWHRGLLIHLQQTGPISRSVLVNLGVLISTMAAAVYFRPAPGAWMAALALGASVAAEWLYLWRQSSTVAHRFRQHSSGIGPGQPE